MNPIDIFGNVINNLNDSGHHKAARRVLEIGWGAMGIKMKHFPDKRLIPADRYLAPMMMDVMMKPLIEPQNSAVVSIFTACELLEEVGLNPYNAEAFSSYISASHAEREMLDIMDSDGISETFCSYHKIFAGAAVAKLMPAPRCIVHTNLICDANLVSFRRMQQVFQVPLFYIDVPIRQDESSVAYVERQLRELKTFLEEVTGKKIDDDALSERVARSKRTLNNYQRFQELRADRQILTDLVSPLYCAMSNNILLGTEQEEKYTQMLLEDVVAAPPKKGKHIYWMHALPYWSDSVYSLLAFNESAQIVGNEIGQTCSADFETDNPYRGMAQRMVYNSLNGTGSRRIDIGIKHAKDAGSDGVVWFNHWGCKHTIGISQLAKKRFEEAGIPCLILDGDACDRSHGGEGQTSTRLSAFLEMIGAI